MWWVKTASGSNMPLDPEIDHARGNVVLRASDNRAIAFGSTEEAKDWIFVHDGDGPYASHFATCPARQEATSAPTQERLL